MTAGKLGISHGAGHRSGETVERRSGKPERNRNQVAGEGRRSRMPLLEGRRDRLPGGKVGPRVLVSARVSSPERRAPVLVMDLMLRNYKDSEREAMTEASHLLGEILSKWIESQPRGRCSPVARNC
jgi:hypothetical protein